MVLSTPFKGAKNFLEAMGVLRRGVWVNEVSKKLEGAAHVKMMFKQHGKHKQLQVATFHLCIRHSY